MVVAVTATVVLVAVLLYGLYAEERDAVVPVTASVEGPDDVVRLRFPTVVRGYDPSAVEAHLVAVAMAWRAEQRRPVTLQPTDHHVPDDLRAVAALGALELRAPRHVR